MKNKAKILPIRKENLDEDLYKKLKEIKTANTNIDQRELT